MSKTYKKLPHGCLRSPRGRRQALINGVRKGAIPPDPWDDIQHDDQCYNAWEVAEEMIKQMMNDEEIHHRIVKKYHISFKKAIEITNTIRERQRNA